MATSFGLVTKEVVFRPKLDVSDHVCLLPESLSTCEALMFIERGSAMDYILDLCPQVPVGNNEWEAALGDLGAWGGRRLWGERNKVSIFICSMTSPCVTCLSQRSLVTQNCHSVSDSLSFRFC